MRPRPTEPIGLYDPAFEHDACGVGSLRAWNGVPIAAIEYHDAGWSMHDDKPMLNAEKIPAAF